MAGKGIESINQVNTDVAKSLKAKYNKKFYGDGKPGFWHNIPSFINHINPLVNSADTTLDDGTRYILDDNELIVKNNDASTFHTDLYKGDAIKSNKPIIIWGNKNGFNAYVVDSNVKVNSIFGTKGNIEGTPTEIKSYGKSNIDAFIKGGSIKLEVNGKSRITARDYKVDANNNTIETYKADISATAKDGGHARIYSENPGTTVNGSAKHKGKTYIEGRNIEGYASGEGSETKMKSTDRNVPSKATAENGATVEYWGMSNKLDGIVDNATMIVENRGNKNHVQGKGDYTYIENGEDKDLPKDNIIKQAYNFIKKTTKMVVKACSNKDEMALNL